MSPLRVGIVGAGNISAIYCENLSKFPSIDLVAISDLDEPRAQTQAEKYDIEARSVDALLGASDIDLVLNITIPKAHGEVALAALSAGKHVYNEKPLAIHRDVCEQMLAVAGQKGLRVGCAPDTFLGAGHQRVRKLIDDGAIGVPVAVHGFMTSRGVESWHPNPEFFYKPGAGPMLDMGPYYLTAFVNLFGAISRLASVTRTTFPERTITSEPHKGEVIKVETPTTFVAAMQFASGVVGQLTTSFDTHSFPGQPNIVVYGSEGTMIVPDPNSFNGWNEPSSKITIRRGNGDEEIYISDQPFKMNSRGLGILDIAHAISEDRPHRASGALAFHVLDVMLSAIESSDESQFINPRTQPDRPTLIGDTEFLEERDLMG
ncbi:MAG: gfo/Idh/MocA family oxidoreductase [Armatimonadetes bacterium]|nr:gfo/Idh/MocA family oxidoreductase [Armatimonadota bacterium]